MKIRYHRGDYISGKDAVEEFSGGVESLIAGLIIKLHEKKVLTSNDVSDIFNFEFEIED